MHFLSDFKSHAPTLVERLEQLWRELYERGFVELGDLQLAQAWIRDLLALGYQFPEIQIAKLIWQKGGETAGSAKNEEL